MELSEEKKIKKIGMKTRKSNIQNGLFSSIDADVLIVP